MGRATIRAVNTTTSRLPATLLSIALLIAACGSSATPSPSASPSRSPDGSPSGSPEPSPSAAGSPATDEELEALAAEITDQVEALRGLTASEPFTSELIDEAELIELLTEAFHEENSAELIAASDGLLKRMGLIPESESLDELYLELLGSQVIGVYDDESKTLYVVSDEGRLGGLEKFTMSHEIDHALQDQMWGIDDVIPEAASEGDAALAAIALTEGDASLLMTQWATQYLTPAELLEVVESSSDPEGQELLARMPPILVETLIFPYSTGLQFVGGVHADGEWSAVNEIYDDVPSSTEQIIHPEAYAEGDEPIDVTVPDELAERMGSGWTVGIEDTFGELQTAVWLANAEANDRQTADVAAAGWGGDRMAYLSGPSDENALIWRTAWDRAADAAEFLRAAEAEVEAIGGSGRVVRTSDTEVLVVLASDGFTLDVALEAAGAPSS
jgi:hypothetical protein